MSGDQRLIPLVVFLVTTGVAGKAGTPLTAEDIVQRASGVLRADWDVVPQYAFLQRDEFFRDGRPASRTHQVVIMRGSDYYMPAAFDDQPLAPEAQQSELRKLKAEQMRRNSETASVTQNRVRSYLAQREQNGRLIVEFPQSFTFELISEDIVNGHEVYVLAATPRKKTGSMTREAKILAAMRGRLWVEKERFHVVRAEATVTSAVSIFGIFARVLPGTHFEFEMESVDETTWLVSRLAIELKVANLWLHSTHSTSTTFSDYRLNDQAIGDMLAQLP